MQVQGFIHRYGRKVFLSAGVSKYDASNFEEFVGLDVYAEVAYYEYPQVITIGDDFGEINGYVVSARPYLKIFIDNNLCNACSGGGLIQEDGELLCCPRCKGTGST